MFISFDRIYERDGRTDRRTDGQTPHYGIGRACIASRQKLLKLVNKDASNARGGVSQIAITNSWWSVVAAGPCRARSLMRGMATRQWSRVCHR